VNKPIARLFTLVLVMFAALIGYTSRWTVFDANALQTNALNDRTLLETRDVQRGTIYAPGQYVIANSVHEDGVYLRQYPHGSLFAAPIGFDFPVQGDAGLEAYQNSVLTGTPLDHESLLDQLEGKQTSGDSVYTTLDPAAQQVAESALEQTHLTGAVVAITPSSGAIRVWATWPTYDPNRYPSSGYRAALGRNPGSPLVDRVSQAEDDPGSIEKVVTAIAAIDSGKFTPESYVNGDSPQTFQGIPLNNDGDTSYGSVTLTYALTNSINTVYANVAQDLGPTLLHDYMARLGYFKAPPIDLPGGELVASGVRGGASGQTLEPPQDWDTPLVGIGEGHLEVTPLQMAMVAAAVANHGILMTPHIAARAVNADGVTVSSYSPSVFSDVMKPATATAVEDMMLDVVDDGTAEKALAGFDIIVAGKTGTAELGDSTNSPNDAWFIAFAPYRDIAVAVVVERTYDYGASAAAPIAREVIQSLVSSGG
jgi:peptidoglycan glycosyltransferase